MVAFTRAMVVPVMRPYAGCVRPLWDVGWSTVETSREWRSAICKQEVLGSILPRSRPTDSCCKGRTVDAARGLKTSRSRFLL